MNTVQKLFWCLTTVSLCSMLPRASAIAQEGCSFLSYPQKLNTLEEGGPTTIGQLRNRPYVILITTDLEAKLPLVRACIPDAFLTSSRLGSYIRVASLDNYWDARDLADYIGESLDMYVRVIHENRLRP